MHKVWMLLAGVLLLPTSTQAQTRNRAIYKGNTAYQKGDFKQAEANYREAFEKQKSNEAAYNLGNALYEQQAFSDAEKAYEHSAKNSSKSNLRAKAWYNKGNAQLSEKKYAEAIDAYKQALRENPAMNDARYNLTYAQTMLKKNQPPPPPPQNKDKQDNKNQAQNNPDSNKNQAPKKPQDKQNKSDQNKVQEAPQPGRLNKNQADELLNALQREERKVREKKEKQKGHPISPEKDW